MSVPAQDWEEGTFWLYEGQVPVTAQRSEAGGW
jgi:hypothetical protein